MQAVASSLAKALGQLADPAILRVLAKSLAITIAIFAGFAAVLWQAARIMLEAAAAPASDALGALVAVLLIALAAWLLFRIVALAVLQFFADEVVLAVERRHYPEAAETARALSFRQDLANSLRGAARALLFNLAALPVAIVLLFTAIGPALLFALVNAVLLGRELTDIGWLRHGTGARGDNPVGRIERFLLGGAVALLMVIPVLNLLAPIIGAAAGTHLVQLRMKKNHVQ